MRFTGWNFLDVDELADTTDASPVGQWVKGVGLAGLVSRFSVDCLATRHAIFPRVITRGLPFTTGWVGRPSASSIFRSRPLSAFALFLGPQSAIFGDMPSSAS